MPAEVSRKQNLEICIMGLLWPLVSALLPALEWQLWRIWYWRGGPV